MSKGVNGRFDEHEGNQSKQKKNNKEDVDWEESEGSSAQKARETNICLEKLPGLGKRGVWLNDKRYWAHTRSYQVIVLFTR